MQQGIVFDIQRYSIDDGPGIRTVVFFKGCPLRCRWCANPESQQAEPQILFNESLCRSCGRCAQAGLQGDIEANARACWYGARQLCGRTMNVEQVMAVVRRDMRYYDNTAGGLTLSGGEPLVQAGFAAAILSASQAENIHTAIETAGCVAWDAFEQVLPNLDLVYMDVKHVDARKHKEFTNADNTQILDNLQRLLAEFENTVVRIPCIPGFNESPEDMEKIFRCIAKRGARKVEVLPFHRFGSGKYRELERVYAYESTQPLKASDIAYVPELGARYGLDVLIRERKG